MHHCITSDNGNFFVRTKNEKDNKEIFLKMDQTGKHLRHKGELFPPKKEYEAAKVAWKKKETPLPAEFTSHVENIVRTYKEPAPIVKKKRKEIETQTT